MTPKARGHVISHALYLPQELDQLRVQLAAGDRSEPFTESGESGEGSIHARLVDSDPVAESLLATVQSLRQDLDAACTEIAELKAQVQELAARAAASGSGKRSEGSP